jgi:hypothetical protein
MRHVMVALFLASAAKEVSAVEEAPGLASRQWPASFALPLPDYSRYEGTPGFPSEMPVSSVLRAAMELIDEDLELEWDGGPRQGLRPDLAQALFMGATGEAFAFLWFPKGAERPPLDPTVYWPDPGAPYKRALTAAGFTCEVLMRPGLAGGPGQGRPLDARTLKDGVRRCLVEQGLPAIIAGIPEPSTFLLVAGYEDDGDVLTGWRASGGGPVSRNAADMVKVRGWTGAAQMAVLLTGRQERPTETAIMRDALEQAVSLLRVKEAGPYHAGPANFEAWAQALLSDDPPDVSVPPNVPPRSVAGRRRWLICPTAWDLMERASYAVRFLRRAAVLFPAAAGELDAASTCMGAVGDLMVQAERAMGGARGPNPEDGYPKADDPEARRQVAGLILQCKDRELEAAEHLAKALPLME